MSTDTHCSYAVILAGGKGTRLWPLSRERTPKQFLDLVGKGSLLQQTFRRARKLFSADHILVVTDARHATLVHEQLSELPVSQILYEPEPKSTCACIGFAALHLQRLDPTAIMVVMASDHLFEDESPLLDALQVAITTASDGELLVTLGVHPTSASTEYGYQEVEARLNVANGLNIYRVKSFIEKPTTDIAHSMIKSGGFFWNTGTFIWKTSTFMDALQLHRPALHAGLLTLEQLMSSGQIDEAEETYRTFESVSIDYAIMEKAANVVMVEADFNRIDVGNLSSLDKLLPIDSEGNATKGNVITLDSSKNIISSSKPLLAVIGMQDVIVIETNGVTVVCPKARAADVKKVVALLKDRGLGEYA